jgi:hypothetical protein
MTKKANENKSAKSIKAKVSRGSIEMDDLTRGYIVDAVKIARSLFVEHVLALAADNLQRAGLVEQLARLAGEES